MGMKGEDVVSLLQTALEELNINVNGEAIDVNAAFANLSADADVTST